MQEKKLEKSLEAPQLFGATPSFRSKRGGDGSSPDLRESSVYSFRICRPHDEILQP